MKRELKFGKEPRRVNYGWLGNVFSWLWKIVIVCAAAFVLVLFFGKRVSNIGDSMNPEIANGDIVLVNTLIYNAKNPSRGDIIVFKPKGDDSMHSYIKRVIGLPGETVEIKDGIVYIDGEELKEEYEATAVRDAGLAAEKIKLGEHEYFVLGDNRQSSTDSRSDEVGCVKKSEIEGKAWFTAAPAKHLGFIK